MDQSFQKPNSLRYVPRAVKSRKSIYRTFLFLSASLRSPMTSSEYRRAGTPTFCPKRVWGGCSSSLTLTEGLNTDRVVPWLHSIDLATLDAVY